MMATRRRHARSSSRRGSHRSRTAVQLRGVPPDREHAFAMYPLCSPRPRRRRTPSVTALAETRHREPRASCRSVSQPVVRRRFGDLLAALPVAHRLEADGFYGRLPRRARTRTDVAHVADGARRRARRRGRDARRAGRQRAMYASRSIAVRARRRLSAPCGAMRPCRRARRSSSRRRGAPGRSLPRRSSLR